MPQLEKSERLKKELGLFQVFAVSMGAMLSSGFFLLPGLAAAKTGPSFIVAYFLAGLLMVPAMLSKAELATAMPRAGGPYYFLDRSMGPLVGTVGGMGTWLVMSLKSAFALIGMGAYLTVFFDVPILPVAIGLTLFFTLLNIAGVKQTVGLQTALVFFVLTVMALFMIEGFSALAQTDRELVRNQFDPFFTHGPGGLFATMGLVVISFAGLAKIASVAEEVENPERNIPLGMILSLAIATSLYVLVGVIMVAVVPATALHDDLHPIASAGQAFMEWLPARISVALIVAAAVAGFAAAANAALFSASRYPLAMARDRLMPSFFFRLSRRFHTPTAAVLLTGGLMLLFLLTLSEEGVAKLASAMLLLISGLVCLAVIVMRESRIDSYDPGFRSPGYPWVQIAGILACGWLIVEIGGMSALFTLGLIVAGVFWYLFYARRRVDRRGALLHVFARLGRERFRELDPELRGIMKEKGLRDEDPFDEVVTRAFAFEADSADFREITERASGLLAERLGVSAKMLTSEFLAGDRISYTPVSHGAALPHARLTEIENPELVLVRSSRGLRLPTGDEVVRGSERDRPVHALIFLVSPDHDPAQHLRILAQIASRVDDDAFMEEWLAASHEAALKEVLLRNERFLRVRLGQDTGAAPWIDRRIRDLDLPEDSLIALVRRRGIGTIVPRGGTQLRRGDRLTVLGSAEGLGELRRRLKA